MQNKKVENPITIAREEFDYFVVQKCNESGLPFFVMEGVLKEIIAKVHDASVKQLELDRRSYEVACSASQDETPHP